MTDLFVNDLIPFPAGTLLPTQIPIRAQKFTHAVKPEALLKVRGGGG